MQQGLQQGLRQAMVISVDNAMKNFHVDFETACKGLGITAEEYRAAKETMKD